MSPLVMLKDLSKEKIKSALRGERRFYLKFTACLIIISLLFFAFRHYRQHITVDELAAFLESLGAWGPVLYVGGYVVIAGNLIPAVILKVLAGALFGVVVGIILVTISATITSSVKFFLARHFFRDRIKKKIDSNEQLKTIDEVLKKEGWKMLIILRNVPVVNSMFLNYICALTGMNFWQFTWASFLGHLPTTVLYVYLGYLLGCTADIGLIRSHPVCQRYTLYIAAAAILLATYYFTHLIKKTLIKQAKED